MKLYFRELRILSYLMRKISANRFMNAVGLRTCTFSYITRCTLTIRGIVPKRWDENRILGFFLQKWVSGNHPSILPFPKDFFRCMETSAETAVKNEQTETIQRAIAAITPKNSINILCIRQALKYRRLCQRLRPLCTRNYEDYGIGSNADRN